MLAATFDIGTTAVKAVVVNENGEPVFTGSSVIHTIETGNFKEQDPDEWYGAFCSLSKEMLEIIPAAEIGAIIFSGQMQDVISVGTEGKALRNAILYSDGRADEQARMIIREAASRNVVPLGDAYIAEITGNHFDGSMPLAKILWLKENEPEIYEKTACFLISSKDYIIGRLTSVFAGDMTACSTAGAMDLDKKIWSEEFIGAAGINIRKFPKLFYAHECVGTVTKTGAAESGYRTGTKVYAGTGDAGATTLASGILAPGEYNINLGTSGWVAAVSNQRMESEGGGFNLAAMQKDLLINVVPFLNGGNVHQLIAKILSRNPDGAPDFGYISELLEKAEPGSHGLFFLRDNSLIHDSKNLIQDQDIALTGRHHLSCEIEAVSHVHQFLVLLIFRKVLKPLFGVLKTEEFEIRLETLQDVCRSFSQHTFQELYHNDPFSAENAHHCVSQCRCGFSVSRSADHTDSVTCHDHSLTLCIPLAEAF